MPTLITGASAGLGEHFARAVAAEGKDLILTARRADRLETLAADLRGKHGVQVHLFPADLADPAAPARLIADITAAGLTIDDLVNNAGYGLRGDFADLDADAQLGIVDVNCRALVALSRAVLPGMIARRSGGILNIASTAAFQPGPWMAVYYASKAFVLSFSEALHEEAKPHGVRVAALCPGPTHTEFAGRAGMTDMALFTKLASGPEAVVRDGLAALRRNQAVKISGAMNAALAESIRLTPRALARRVAGAMQRARR
ncbi:SDR family NAD(P)-dependent oxidoreductase [Sphingomonas sp.]|uniref:SDR family NAD(P)-dependent oxidoreductase n=1 Tax=Sphingomonas sp. TaxID=28214 RepID=UPI003B00FAAB